ncbi:MAG TPA: D-glycerate dehydrogenase [Paenibacillus sp.]|uniref:2-hydroxyacid dehydrogenase n=1 Tax=Paenibacillus sp. TaxID=58172 RepID=UPI0028D1C3ED|nr:D-glycerate dehydrogenase [Paenibacillus sp.]HUC90458.1 D-glycerate dehydrogenase [Paenibacillus sp.]
MKPKIYVTRKLNEGILAKLEETCEVTLWEEENLPVPREVLEREIREADGLFCLLTEQIDAALLEKAPRLKIIANLAVGYNHIDIEAATAKGIMVTNTPGVLTETTADLTFALLMATARRLVESSDYLRRGAWVTWSPMLLTGQDVYGSTLGIIGLGRIGEAVARRAKAFDMKVYYHNRTRKPEAEEQLGLEYCDMATLLRESDFVCILVPYTPGTRHLIGHNELALMKQSAILINTSRGGIIDETALYYALAEGKIWAAGLDVFEQEPVPANHPLLTLPNVVTLPHIGSASIKTRLRMADIAADNLLKGLAGLTPPNLVNPQVDARDTKR